MSDNEPQCGRRASTADGDLDRHLDVLISTELEESLIVLARIHGFKNRSEYVRNLLHKHVFGEMEALQRLVHRSGPGNLNNRG